MSITSTTTIKQVSHRLQVSDRTIRNWVKDGKFPLPIKVGRQLRWHPEDIERWLHPETSATEFVVHDTNSGSISFILVKPTYRVRTKDGLLALFQTSDGSWHTRAFRTQTVWGAGPELLELSCEDWGIDEIHENEMPPIATVSDEENAHGH